MEFSSRGLEAYSDGDRGNVIFWNVHSTSSSQIYGMHTSVALSGKNKIDTLQAQLEGAYERYIKIRRSYEEEMKKTYVLEQKTLKLENEVATLKNIVRTTTKIHDRGVQIEGQLPEIGDASGQIDEEDLELGKETEIRTIKNLRIHKINALKLVSQNVHNNYLALQGVEYRCSEAVALLSPLFTTWGPYTPFFDSLVPILAQKKDLPKVMIINVRKMINKVKDLNGFFAGKLQQIQNKMKVIAAGTPSFVPTILDSDGKIKDWVEWSSSFDNILDHPRFLAYCNNEASVAMLYDLIDMLYRLETKMSKTTVEVKAITDAKWNKCLEELDAVRDATWPDIDTDIAIWDVIADIKALPSSDSD